MQFPEPLTLCYPGRKTVWGLNMPGNKRAKLLMAMANAIEAHFDELTAIEALDSGKNVFKNARGDVQRAIDLFTYYAGWCDVSHPFSSLS